MSAFSKLQNYSAKYRNEKSDVFDVKTPLGAYYDRVHKNGLAMYKNVLYKLKDEYAAKVKQAAANTKLPEKPDYDAINQLSIKINKMYL